MKKIIYLIITVLLFVLVGCADITTKGVFMQLTVIDETLSSNRSATNGIKEKVADQVKLHVLRTNDFEDISINGLWDCNGTANEICLFYAVDGHTEKVDCTRRYQDGNYWFFITSAEKVYDGDYKNDYYYDMTKYLSRPEIYLQERWSDFPINKLIPFTIDNKEKDIDIEMTIHEDETVSFKYFVNGEEYIVEE